MNDTNQNKPLSNEIHANDSKADFIGTPNQTNACPPPYYPYPIPCEEDEIDLIELWNILWQGKWFIIGFTFLCTTVAIAFALLATPYYKAEVIMAPVEEESRQGGLNALAAQYGGLASLAGINLSSGSNNVETNLAIIKSREFVYRFIEDNNLVPILFEEMWDKENNTWFPTNPKDIPTLWKAYKAFMDGILKVNQDNKSGLVTLSILWKNPETTAKWANDLVNRINAHIRKKAINEAQKSINYLENEIAKTSDVSMCEVLYRLIEKQTQTITLAQVREQYAFDIIDQAVVPEKRAKPNRRMIVILGTTTGGFFSIFLWFFFVFIRSLRNKKPDTDQETVKKYAP